MSRTLAYGDIIRIHCRQQDNKDGGNKIGGFLMSKGFADANIYFLKSKEFTQFELRNSLFQILPYSSFQIHDEAKKKKQQAKANNIKLEISQNMKSSMKTEQEQFRSKSMKQRKMEVNFDSEVVIRHVNSNSYLQGQFSCPQTGIGSFKLILSEDLSSDVKFKITRFRNSDKQAEQIQSKDQFIIYHCSSHCYLNIGDITQKVFLDKEIVIDSYEGDTNPAQLARQDNEAYKYFNQRPLIKCPNDGNNKIQRYQVVNMSKPTLILNFLLEKSSRDEVAESVIEHNDVIYIRNTKNDSYLTADLWSSQISLVSYTGEKAGNFPYEGIWEVSVPRSDDKGQVSNIKTYFLKHYITDKVCSVEAVDNKLKRLQLDSGMSFRKKIDTFKIVTYQSEKTLNHRDLVFLQRCESLQQAVVHGSFQEYGSDNSNPSYLDIGGKIQKIYRSKLEQKREQNSSNYSLELTEGPLINAFQIFKLQEKKLRQINKILSCVQILTNFCNVLIVSDNIIRNPNNKNSDQQDVFLDLKNMKNSMISQVSDNDTRFQHKTSIRDPKKILHEASVQELLTKYLNYYMLNLVIKTIDYLFENVKKPSKKPDFEFMIMIRSLGLMEILIEAVFFIQRNLALINKEQNSDISRYLKKKKYLRDRLEDCFRKVYNLLFELSQQNSCRLYLGNWFNMFLSQFYTIKADYIHILIIELLKEKFIIKTMKQSHIIQCIENMKKQGMNSTKNFKYLELLSSFCRSKNSAIPANQLIIMKKLSSFSELFYLFDVDQQNDIDDEDKKYQEKNQIRFTMKDSTHILQNFQGQKWNYIIYLLNLYADLIFEQSTDNIRLVQKCIKTNTVKIFFSKKDYSERKDLDVSIVDSFLKLAHYFLSNQVSNSKNTQNRIDREESLYIIGDHSRNLDQEASCQESSNLFKQYRPVINFIIDEILKVQRNAGDYSIYRLKTLQTSLNFLIYISKIFHDPYIVEAIRLTIEIVLKLKNQVIYESEDYRKNILDRIYSSYASERNDINLTPKDLKSIVESRQLAIKSHDSHIEKNTKKLLSIKPRERLLIDTRSKACEILDIRLNLIVNEGLQQLNEFFTDVCDNKVHVQAYNHSRSLNFIQDPDSSIFYAENSHWIWINKIIQITDKTMNVKLNDLIRDGDNGKNTIVKLLIQCIFVQSLKIVNKIMMLIFRLYELRKTLMFRFRDSFIVKTNSFINIVNLNNKWMSDFQKTKVGDQKHHQLMKNLQISSLAIRFFELSEVQQAFNKKIQKQQQQQLLEQIKVINKQVRKGLSFYIVLNQKQTHFSTNQILLQKMVSNQKMHIHVISYIKTLKQGSKNYDEHLNIAYEFLTLLIYNNTRNKKMLTKDIKIVLNHINSNCRAIQFLKQIITENQNILNNRELVYELVSSILENAHSVDGDQNKVIIKAKLIESLGVFCSFQGRSHVENQTLIMIQMQNKKYDNSIMFSTLDYNKNKYLNSEGRGILSQMYKMGLDDYLMKPLSERQHQVIEPYSEINDETDETSNNFKKYPQIHQDFAIFRSNYNEVIRKKIQYQNREDSESSIQESNVVQIPHSLMYLTAYFSTMSALVEGNHIINRGKCCNMHPYQSLVSILDDISKCWPLARHARAYLIKLYFSELTDKEKSTQKSLIMTNNMKGLTKNSIKTNPMRKQNIKDLQNFLGKLFKKQINLITDRLRSINNDLLDEQSQIYKIQIQTPIRYQYMGSYLYCLMQEILFEVLIFFERIKMYVQDPRKDRKISKQQSNNLKQLLKVLGTTFQLLGRCQKKTIAKKLIEEIYKTTIQFVKVIDLEQQNHLDAPDIQKKLDDKVKASLSYSLIKNDVMHLKKSRCSQFMTYYFFLSYQQQNGIIIANNSERQPESQQKQTISPEESIIKSYIKKLIPGSFFRKQSQLETEEESKKKMKVFKQIESSDKQIRVNKLLQVITQDLVERKQSYDMIQQQLDQLVKLCSNLDQPEPMLEDEQFQLSQYKYRVIGYNKFMTNIISLVTKSPNHLTLQGKIKTIKLIRMIFEEKVNTSCQIDNKEWDSGLFQNQKLIVLKKIQNKFKQLNLDKMIVAILKEQSPSYILLAQTFKLGIKFLYNGNSQCQSAILNNLKQDSENKVMVELFNFIRRMRSQISQGKFNTNKENQKQSNRGNKKIQTPILDNFHYFDIKNKCMTQLGTEKDKSKQFQEEVKIKIKCVCRAYQFLQLMCENDNQTSKNFLRQQTNPNGNMKYNSINFVSQTSKLFKVLLQSRAPQQQRNIILKYLADFFIEVTQLPCTENQLQLCSTSIFSDIRYHALSEMKNQKQDAKSTKPIKDNIRNNDDKRMQNSQKFAGPQKTMCFLMDFVINAGLSLLEGSSQQIYKSLIASLDHEFIYTILKYQEDVLKVLGSDKHHYLRIDQFDDQTLKILLTDDAENAKVRKRIYMVYNLFILIEKLSKYVRQNKSHINDQPLVNKLVQYYKEMESKNSQNKPNGTNQPRIDILNFCSKKLKHIEVVFQEKKQYLYFPDLPVFKKITEETKTEILENIKRDTQVDKITDFLVKSTQINNLMNWNYKVEDRLSLSMQTLQWIRLQILFLTLAIVGLYIVFTTVTFVEVNGKIKMLKSIDNPVIESIVNVLCVFHLFSSIYFVFTWCTLKYRMSIQRQYIEQQQPKIEELLKKVDTDAAFQVYDYFTSLRLILKNQKQIYSIILFFIVFSLMGYFVGIQWYSMLVFDMITRNKTLKSVIQAITSNLQQLLVVSLLILAFVYVFNIMSIQFSLYLPLVYQNEEEKCTILSDCVISLYTSGEIGEKHKEFKFAKFFADLLYIVIMELLFSNIVSGIVIDTFAQLRDQRKTIQTDTLTKCFICGISKATLQKQLRQSQDATIQQNSGMKIFKSHIQDVHSHWNYIYYLYILSQKDITTYTGIEYYIKNQKQHDQYDWIPTYKEDDDKDIKEILEITQRLVPKIKQRIQNKNQLTL